MNSLIANAIRSKHRLQLLHLARRHSARIVEPHALGTDGYGKELLLCYDITDPNRTSCESGWQLLTLDESVTVIAVDEKFDTARSGYLRGDTGICQVLAQL